MSDDHVSFLNNDSPNNPTVHSGELIAYSSSEEHSSFGDHTKGGVWTYYLCKYLQKNLPITEVLSLTSDQIKHENINQALLTIWNKHEFEFERIISHTDESIKPGLEIKQEYTIDNDHVNRKKNEMQKFIEKENNPFLVQGIVIALGIKSQVEIIETTFMQMGYVVFKQSNTSCSDIACLIQAIAEGNYPENIKHVIFYFAGYGGSDRLGGSSFITGRSNDEILPLEEYVIEPLQKLKITRLFLFDCYHGLIEESEKFPKKIKFSNSEIVVFALHKFQRGNPWTSSLCNSLMNRKEPVVDILNEVFSNDSDLEPFKSLHHYGNLTAKIVLCANKWKLECFKALKKAFKKNETICCSVVQCIPFGPPMVGKSHFYHRLLNIPYVRTGFTGVAEEKDTIIFNIRQLSSTSTKTCVIEVDEKWRNVKNDAEWIHIYLETIRTIESRVTNTNKEDTGTCSSETKDASALVISTSAKSSNKNQEGSSIQTDVDATTSIEHPFPSTGHFQEDKNQEVHASSHPRKENSNNADSPLEEMSVSFDESTSRKDDVQDDAFDQLIQSADLSQLSDNLKVLHENSATMFYTDTGGQPEFQEVLPCLVGGPTLFLLVFDLSKGLDNQFGISYSDNRSIKSTLTVKEVLMQYLTTIWSYYNGLSPDDRCSVKILMLATHKDKVPAADVEQEILKVNNLLESAEIVKSVKKNNLFIQADQSSIIHAIDNTNESCQSDDIRSLIEKTIADENNNYRQHRKANFLCFELALRKNESPLMEIEECKKLAGIFNISGEDFFVALDDLHKKMGVIRYYRYHDELNKYVLTKPAVLFEAITKLICTSFERSNTVNHCGFLREQDVDKIFEKKIFESFKEYFVHLLEYFSILIPANYIEGNITFHYFLPCALTHFPPTYDDKICTYSLLLLFRNHGDEVSEFIPVGFFSNLIGSLRKYKWSITSDFQRRNLYCNQVIFSVSTNDSFEIKVKSKAFFIEFSILGKNESEMSICKYDVYDLLKNQKCISDICERLQCKGLKPFYGLYCSLPRCDSNTSPHFAEYTGLQNSNVLNMRCSLTGVNYPLESGDVRKFWFQKAPLEPAQDTEDTILNTDENVISVMEYTHDITDWGVLCLRLGLSRKDHHSINTDPANLSANAKHMAIVTKWLETGSASWTNLEKNLRDPLVKRKDIANQIAKDHPNRVTEKLDKEKDAELTSLAVKEPIVKEQSTQTQFNYTSDCLDDVHIGGETVHLIEGSHTQSFNWTRWGIRMYFSKNSLLSNETCEVAVKALVGGKFKFPSDCELISAVYAISFVSGKLAKPVRLEIQHCALLKEESQFKYLSFVKAPMRERIPPFEFSPLEGGSFDLNSQYGFITLDQFCLIGIIRRIFRRIRIFPLPDHPEPESSDITDTVNIQPSLPPDIKCTGRFCYTHVNVNQWRAIFMAVKNLDALQMFIHQKYPDSELGQAVLFQFDKNKTKQTLELVMNSDQNCDIAGWDVLPHSAPLIIEEDDIIKFGSSDGIPEPPHFMFDVSATPTPETRSLQYHIPIKGVVPKTQVIYIVRLLKPTSTEQSGVPRQRKRKHSDHCISEDESGDAKKHDDEVEEDDNMDTRMSSNKSLAEGCVLTRKRKIENSEDNSTILMKRCNNNSAAIGGNENILILSGSSQPSILNKIPSKNDAYNVLSNKSADWDDIGRALDIVSGNDTINKRKGLHKNIALSDSARLEKILNTWLQQGGASSTWNQLIEALKVLKYIDIVMNIKVFLGLTDEV